MKLSKRHIDIINANLRILAESVRTGQKIEETVVAHRIVRIGFTGTQCVQPVIAK